MSWEAWGSDEPFDVEQLYRRGWESDENGAKWWKVGEPETTFTLQQAIEIYEERLYETE